LQENTFVDENRRRLTRDESVALLQRPLAGVLSTLSTDGWIHSVPVHFLYAANEVRILAGMGAVKVKNAVRAGQATLCVEVTDGPVRSFVTVCGPVTLQRPPAKQDLIALDRKYGRDDFASGWDEAAYADAVIMILHPDRWIAWADWD
jgi:hypothetical protein